MGVLSEPEEGLHWIRRHEHGPSCRPGLWRRCAAWYHRSSGCGDYWNREAFRLGQVNAAASPHKGQGALQGSLFFLLSLFVQEMLILKKARNKFKLANQAAMLGQTTESTNGDLATRAILRGYGIGVRAIFRCSMVSM